MRLEFYTFLNCVKFGSVYKCCNSSQRPLKIYMQHVVDYYLKPIFFKMQYQDLNLGVLNFVSPPSLLTSLKL